MKKLFHIFLILLISGTINYSQSYSFQNINEKNGLSENRVIDIFQDSWGFLWFVTPDGANHYDGYKFKTLRNNPFDQNSISPGITTAIAEDAKENIWIGTTRGLNKFDRLTNSFKFYSAEDGLSYHQITTLFTDSEGLLWVGMGDIIGNMNSGGLAYFDSNANHFNSFNSDSLDENSLSQNHVTSIVEDNNGNLWIGTFDGLNKYDKLTKSFIRFYFNKKETKSEKVSHINDLFYDSYNNLWIASNEGLMKFDEKEKSFSNLNFSSEITSPIRIFTVYETPSEKGVLWIGTEIGLFEYNIKTKNSSHYKNEKNDSESLPSNEIRKIYEDRSGIIWIAAGNSGLAKLNRFAPRFKNIKTDIPSTFASENNIFSITKNHSGNLLAGTYERIINVDMNSGRKSQIKRSVQLKKLLEQNRIVSLFEDKLRRLWIGTSDNGIVVIDSSDVVAHLSNNSSVAESKRLLSNRISFVASIDDKSIWVGTKGGGLDRIDAETLEITPYPIFDTTRDNRVNLLSYFFDEDSSLWLGTTRGIRKFDLGNKQFVNYEHEDVFNEFIGDDMIPNIIKTKTNKDILWLGTFNRGLCKLNLSTGEFKRITTQNSSLSSNTIMSMLTYGNKTIWISTNNSLVRFDSKTEEIRIYADDDGSSNEQYNMHSVYKGKDGKYYFGGTNGIVYFDPSKVRKNLFLPQLVINNFLINGKSIIKKGNKSLVQHIIDEKEINLDYDQNTFRIDFAALHYASPKNNKYEYQLVNYDENPIRTTEKRSVTYMNLSPGEYKFTLRAENADGISAANKLAFSVIIKPPYYKTWWAYLVYILIFIGFFFQYRKYEIKKQLEAARLKESELRATQAELRAETAAAEAKIVQIENERKSKELEDARKLQLSMLPEVVPTSDKYEIAVYMKTASEVGGDYYDFTLSDDGTLNIGFGDATGHGMQAGVLVSLIKGLFVSDSSENDIATFMLKSNNTIKKSKLGRIMMAFSLLKLKDYSLHVSSAGMPPIYIYSESNNHVEEINLMGMPLGAMLNFPFKDIEIEVAKGDTILLMSDGLPEMTNRDDEQFEYYRISKLFKEIGVKSSREIVDEIVEVSDNWLDGKALEDDITILVMKIK